MACKHKFYTDLKWENLNYGPKILFVGTFNPEWPASNYAQWFYGRTDSNYFWEVLPRLMGKKSLLCSSPETWKTFCKTNKIAITDLILEIENANPKNKKHAMILSKYSDDDLVKHFKNNLELNKITEILDQIPSIQSVYLTRSASGFWGQQWKQITGYTKRKIHFAELLTPSRYASYQLSKYRKDNVNTPMSLPDYILKRWQEKVIESKKN